jgi:hypothetical protein
MIRMRVYAHPQTCQLAKQQTRLFRSRGLPRVAQPATLAVTAGIKTIVGIPNVIARAAVFAARGTPPGGPKPARINNPLHICAFPKKLKKVFDITRKVCQTTSPTALMETE